MSSRAAPSGAIKQTGAELLPADRREVSVGALSFTLEGLALRWIRLGDVELLRGIAFVVRDRDWGTFQPEVRVEEFAETAAGILIRLAAEIVEGEASLTCRTVVSAAPERLAIEASVVGHGRFMTNRTGFVVLHGAASAGGRSHVVHAAGGTTEGTFPPLVSPHQPFFDIAAITHEPAPGIIAEVQFSGEVFEMEDQRNWSDASFKTYSRPLARPFPYVIADGERVRQTVSVTIRGRPSGSLRTKHELPRIEAAANLAGRLPEIGLGGRAIDYRGTAALSRRLADLAPSVLLFEAKDDDPCEEFAAAVAASGARTSVMLRPEGRGLEAWSKWFARAGVAPSAVALVTSERAIVEQARRLFPGARIGTGTDAFFAEFNRQPPPPADFHFWTVNPTVHAIDDASVMETLSVLADQVASARARSPGVPLQVGPITFRMRFNPNAAGPSSGESPGVLPAEADARQRGLLGAAFTLGQIAAWAAAGIETLVMFAPFGPRGLIHARGGFPVPWYDGLPEGAVYPAYLVLAAMGGRRPIRLVSNEVPENVVALATDDALWLANRGPAAIEISVPGTEARMLDEASFAEAVARPVGFWSRGAVALAGGRLRLGGYAVARLPF
ncbi:MAG: hypothetical protein ACREFV_08280 [Acetobacteraceae bacterium]